MKPLRLISLFILILLASCTSGRDPQTIYQELEFNLKNAQIENFKVTKSIEEQNMKINIFTNSKSNYTLQVYQQSLDQKDALKIINQKTNEIRLLFMPTIVPYTGYITQNYQCTSKININNTLVESKTEFSVYYDLTANEHFVFGSCLAEQEIYKSQVLFIYCKNSKILYELKLFYPKHEDYKPQMARCRS